MANILKCVAYFFTNGEPLESRSRSLKLQSIDEFFEPKKYFNY